MLPISYSKLAAGNSHVRSLCVLVRVGIIHKSKFIPGTVEKTEDLIVDEFFSTVPGKDFDLCIIPTRTKTHKPFRKIIHIE